MSNQAARYVITIEVHDGGDITAEIEGVDPLDLLQANGWDDAQKSAAEIWIGLGLPKQTLENMNPEGSA